MIIFNTIKKAQHYVKFCNKNSDYSRGNYDWSEHVTYIEDNCGCDTYIYNHVTIIGRIKAYDTKTIRGQKLNQLI